MFEQTQITIFFRYTKEYEAYKQTEAYKQFNQQQTEKKVKDIKEKESDSKSSITSVSIFEFEVNKVVNN